MSIRYQLERDVDDIKSVHGDRATDVGAKAC